MGILQARIVEWVAMSSSMGSSQHKDQTQVSHIAGGFFTIWTTKEAWKSLSHGDSMGCNLPGSSVHGILQARILEWTAIPFSRSFSNPGIEPRSPTLQADSLPSESPGKPKYVGKLFITE